MALFSSLKGARRSALFLRTAGALATLVAATFGSVGTAHAGYWNVSVAISGSASFTGTGAGTTLGFLQTDYSGSAPTSVAYNWNPTPTFPGGSLLETTGVPAAVVLDSSVQTLSGSVNGTVVGVPSGTLTYPEVSVSATWVPVPFDSDGDGSLDNPDNAPLTAPSLSRQVDAKVAWGAVSCTCYGGNAHIKLDNFNSSGALTGEIIEAQASALPGPAPLRGSLTDLDSDSDSIAALSYSGGGTATWHFPIIDMTHWLNCDTHGQGQNGGISQVKLSLYVN